LTDRQGKLAGNVDLVLVSYDAAGEVTDFGALETQAVYVSGNVRRPFEYYIGDPAGRASMDWSGQPHYPNPDYLSSSRKRLAPQLMFKGGIFRAWGKKVAVALQSPLFETLPALEEIEPAQADIAWLVYDLVLDSQHNVYHLRLHQIVHTQFAASLQRIAWAEPGSVEEFVEQLQQKLDERLANDERPDIEVTDAPF